MYGFNVGDRVEFSYKEPLNRGQLRPGSTGTIVAIEAGSPFPIGVEWDEYMNGHNLWGRCKSGYGWWVGSEQVSLYSEEPEVPFDALAWENIIGA